MAAQGCILHRELRKITGMIIIPVTRALNYLLFLVNHMTSETSFWLGSRKRAPDNMSSMINVAYAEL